VHTVVAFIFSMTLRPGWNSTVHGIFLSSGGLFRNRGLIIIIAIFRRSIPS
jgi:hypothetical protein